MPERDATIRRDAALTRHIPGVRCDRYQSRLEHLGALDVALDKRCADNSCGAHSASLRIAKERAHRCEQPDARWLRITELRSGSAPSPARAPARRACPRFAG